MGITSHKQHGDKDRIYDRRLGEMAAQKRAEQGSSGRPMKYYRPGDPSHPSVKPISAGFKQKQAALDQLSKQRKQTLVVSSRFLVEGRGLLTTRQYD